jgi:hypothetical protein
MKSVMMYPGVEQNPLPFHQCPSCKIVWPTRESLLADPGVRLIGYRSCLANLLAGVFLFHHRCEAIVTIHASEFADFYDGPMFSVPQTGGEKCPGYCLRVEELRPCPAPCECAFVREIVNLVNNWPKRGDLEYAAAAYAGLPR